MKNLKLVLSIFLTLFGFHYVTFGQRSNTKIVRVEYVKPPLKPLSEDLTTYFVEFSCKPDFFRDHVESFSPRNFLVLSGYTKVNSMVEADILIAMTINSLTRNTKITSQVLEVDQGDGTKKDTRLFYGESEAILNSTVRIKDLKNNRAIISVEGHETKHYLFTQGLRSKQEVNSDLATKDETGLVQYTEAFSQRILPLAKGLENQFGFPVLIEKLPIEKGKGRKYDYSNLESAFERFKDVTSNKQFVTDNSERTTLIECIKVWENAAAEYDEKVKRARINLKIVGGLYQNIAYAYFMLKDWDNVYAYCEKAQSFEGHEKRAGNFYEFSRQLHSRYKINSM